MVDDGQQQVLLDDVRILVALQIDVGDQALHPVLALEPFGQVAEEQFLAQEHLAVGAEDVALVEAEVVAVALRLFGIHGGRSVEDAGGGEEAGAHADQEMAGVAADVVVLAGDEIADGIGQHLLGEVLSRPIEVWQSFL